MPAAPARRSLPDGADLAAAGHPGDASSYGDVIVTVDVNNGNLAASLCKMLQMWRKLPEPLKAEARGVLERVQARKGCSKNAGEVAATALR